MTEREKSADAVERFEHAGSSIVLCGDPAQVQAGSALALKLIGVAAPLPHVSGSDPHIQEGDDRLG